MIGKKSSSFTLYLYPLYQLKTLLCFVGTHNIDLLDPRDGVRVDDRVNRNVGVGFFLDKLGVYIVAVEL